MHRSGDPRGQLVRPYAVTAGRERPVEMAVEALLRATDNAARDAAGSGRDRQFVVELCTADVQSLAELSARLGRPLGVTRIVVAELVERGLLYVEDTGYSEGEVSVALLERVLSGLHKL